MQYLIDDPSIVSEAPTKLWRSRNGGLFLDEQSARYDGCTHVYCELCGAPAQKGRLYCPDCALKDAKARESFWPEEPWDGKCMIYSRKFDRFFESPEEAQEYCEAEECPLADARLVLCRPEYPRELDLDDFDPPEEGIGEAEDVLKAAIKEFNQKVAGLVIGWVPRNVRLRL